MKISDVISTYCLVDSMIDYKWMINERLNEFKQFWEWMTDEEWTNSEQENEPKSLSLVWIISAINFLAF